MNALAIPIPAIRSDIARLGGHGGGGDDVEARIATLESDVRHIRSDVSDIKVDLRRLDDKFESMRTEFSGQIQDVRTDLSGQITQVRSELSGKFDDLARSLASGTRQTNDRLSGSICDALLAPTPGDVTFPLAQRLLGPGLVVTDDEVLDAMELAFREFKLVVEPGGAVALAAALTGKLPVKGRAVAVVCSGGNVDHATFQRALSRGAA